MHTKSVYNIYKIKNIGQKAKENKYQKEIRTGNTLPKIKWVSAKLKRKFH